MADYPDFSVVDYCVFIATLVISFGIGIASSFKGNKSPEEYLLGNRSLGVIPVSLSLLTSFVSAISFIGFTSEVYAFGVQISLLAVGTSLGIVLSGVITLPVLYELEMTSMYEYLELRFKSPTIRIGGTLTIFIQAVVFMGVCVYAPSLALASVTPLNFEAYILIMGCVCTVYSTIGGIRAVVWTDVFQFFIMTIGLVIIIVAAAMQMGLEDIFSIAKEGGRLEFFNMNPSIYERHNFYNTFAFGFFFNIELFGIAQIILQRVCAVSTIQKARQVLVINAVGMLVIHAIIFFGGLAVYAIYATCDPLLSGKIKKKDELLSFFVADKLSFIPGIAGIFVSTLMATTLSTFSSVVNAQTAIVWKDCLAKLKIFSNVTPKTAVLINKCVTFLIGIVFMGMAILTSRTQSMIQLVMTVGGIAFGALYGVFILGMYFPRCNLKGAWSGLLLSFGFMTWIYCGSLYYLNDPEMLPLSTEMCEGVSNISSTIYNDANSSFHDVFVHINGTTGQVILNPETNSQERFPLMYLYGISYTLYPIIGPIICVIIGILVSYITGPTDPQDVAPELIAPCLRKFYKANSKLKR